MLEEVVLAGQRLDRGDLGGSERAAARQRLR